MPYVARDGSSNIVSICLNQTAENDEFLAEDDDQVKYFKEKNSLYHDLLLEAKLREGFITYNGSVIPLCGIIFYSFNTAINNARIAGDTDVTIHDASSNIVIMPTSEAVSLQQAIRQYLDDISANFEVKREAYLAASNYTELMAIDVQSGWPAQSW